MFFFSKACLVLNCLTNRSKSDNGSAFAEQMFGNFPKQNYNVFFPGLPRLQTATAMIEGTKPNPYNFFEANKGEMKSLTKANIWFYEQNEQQSINTLLVFELIFDHGRREDIQKTLDNTKIILGNSH